VGDNIKARDGMASVAFGVHGRGPHSTIRGALYAGQITRRGHGDLRQGARDDFIIRAVLGGLFLAVHVLGGRASDKELPVQILAERALAPSPLCQKI